MGIPVFGISAVSGEGVNDLLYYLYDVIRKTDRTPKIFEKEFEIESTWYLSTSLQNATTRSP